MERKKLFSHLIWVLLAVFLLWYFFWPVSLPKRLPADGGYHVLVQQTDAQGAVTETVYLLPEDSQACRQLQTLLEQTKAYSIIDASGNAVRKGALLDRQYLIQGIGGEDYLYLGHASRVVSNGTTLRLGLFRSDSAADFVQSLEQCLTAGGVSIVEPPADA